MLLANPLLREEEETTCVLHFTWLQLHSLVILPIKVVKLKPQRKFFFPEEKLLDGLVVSGHILVEETSFSIVSSSVSIQNLNLIDQYSTVLFTHFHQTF